MKRLLIAVFLSAVLPQFCFADSEQTASRYVEYWNMGEGRATRNESVFTQEFINRRGPDGLARLRPVICIKG
jgi:hypothetical protein